MSLLAHDSDDERESLEDTSIDAEFVLVDEAQYPDGTLLVPTVRLELSRAWARRSVLVVFKFQKQAIVSRPQKVSANGNVRFDLKGSFDVSDYTPRMQLTLTVYLRPRFGLGSVRFLNSVVIDLYEEVLKHLADQTPGREQKFSLAGRNAYDNDKGVAHAVLTFFTRDEHEQMNAFLNAEHERQRAGSAASLPRPTLQSSSDAGGDDDVDIDANEHKEEEEEEFEDKQIDCLLCGATASGRSAFALDCAHAFCDQCLRTHIEASLHESTVEVPCPRATATQACVVGQWALRALLPKDRFDAYLDASLRVLLANSGDQSTFFQCPAADCGAIMERIDDAEEEEDDDDDDDDDKTKVEQTTVAQHKRQHRFRCRACQTVFCQQCHAMPYHDGYTCDGFREFLASARCRFCDELLKEATDTAHPPALQCVCERAECVKKRDKSCDVTLDCGHACGGVRNEKTHLRCLQCVDENGDALGGEWCDVCYVDPLEAAPSIELKCGHVLHLQCAKQRLRARWNGPVIAFQFLDCPLCNKPMEHARLRSLTQPAQQFKESVEAKANQRLTHEGLANCDEVVNPQSRFYKKPVEYAMARYAYYQCHECLHAYFAGQKSCQDAGGPGGDDGFDPKELICGSCSGEALGSALQQCTKHGAEFLEYKCFFCCAPATFFCWNTTHFCDACHKEQRSGNYLTRKELSYFKNCNGRKDCPLRIEHPPNGTKVNICLGCAICRQSLNY